MRLRFVLVWAVYSRQLPCLQVFPHNSHYVAGRQGRGW